MNFRQWLLTNEGVEDEPYSFKAVFMAGGPGSGKSHIAQQMFGPLKFMFADSDKIQITLSKNQGRPLAASADDPRYAEFLRTMQRAQELSAKRASYWYDRGLPVVIDTTGRDLGLVHQLNKHLQEKGYDTGMVFVYCDLQTAIQRNASRERQAEPQYLEAAWRQAQENREAYKHLFGSRFVVIDNSGQGHQGDLRRYANVVIGRPHSLQNPIGRQKMQERLAVNFGAQPRTARAWAKNVAV